MSEYYRRKSVYNPESDEAFKVSRSKIDLFTQCPKCFYLDARLGIKRPSMPGFSLNIAVDHLLKKEFDIHRAAKKSHPMMDEYGVDAIPFDHPNLDIWRENFKGIRYHHEPTNLLITGAIDDVWVNDKDELIIVDYKATSKKDKPTLDGRWGEQYKRQMEIYQWLFRQNGFTVSPTGYFVYVNGKKDVEAFDAKLEFDVDVIPYTGDTNWIDQKLEEIKDALDRDEIPQSASDCDHCRYASEVSKLEVGDQKALLP